MCRSLRDAAHFDDFCRAALKDWGSKAKYFVTLQCVKPACLNRCVNRVAPVRKDKRTGNTDIERLVKIVVDVDANEAQTLIELTELLFDEWYVAREARSKRLEHLKSIADAKSAAGSSFRSRTGRSIFSFRSNGNSRLAVLLITHLLVGFYHAGNH